jgi:hypothetical protein
VYANPWTEDILYQVRIILHSDCTIFVEFIIMLIINPDYKGKGKGKAHPLQAMQAQRGLGELRLLDFLTSALYGDTLSASRTGRLYPQVLVFTRG